MYTYTVRYYIWMYSFYNMKNDISFGMRILFCLHILIDRSNTYDMYYTTRKLNYIRTAEAKVNELLYRYSRNAVLHGSDVSR